MEMKKAGGGKEVMQCEEGPGCFICRVTAAQPVSWASAGQFTVLSSVCVRHLRSRSLKFSTWVLGCTTGRGSMLCVTSLTWNEPCHTHPVCIWYYHPSSAIQLSSWFHMSEANPTNDKRNPKRCLKDIYPKGRARQLIKKESLALLFCAWVTSPAQTFDVSVDWQSYV